jgi:hypothetical protein
MRASFPCAHPPRSVDTAIHAREARCPTHRCTTQKGKRERNQAKPQRQGKSPQSSHFSCALVGLGSRTVHALLHSKPSPHTGSVPPLPLPRPLAPPPNAPLSLPCSIPRFCRLADLQRPDPQAWLRSSSCLRPPLDRRSVRPFCYRAALARARAASAAPITPVRLCNHTRWGGGHITLPPASGSLCAQLLTQPLPPASLVYPAPQRVRCPRPGCVSASCCRRSPSACRCAEPRPPSLAALIFVLETPLDRRSVRPFCCRAALARARAAIAAPITPVRLCNHTRWGGHITVPPAFGSLCAQLLTQPLPPASLVFTPPLRTSIRSECGAPAPVVCLPVAVDAPRQLADVQSPDPPAWLRSSSCLRPPSRSQVRASLLLPRSPCTRASCQCRPDHPPCVSAITLAGGSHHRARRIRQTLRAAPHPTVAPASLVYPRPSALRSAASAVPPPRLCVCQLLSMLPVSLPMCRAPTPQPGCAHLRA